MRILPSAPGGPLFPQGRGAELGYFSARVALSPARIEEFERLLYDNARSQIDEKLTFALSHMPECGQPAPSRKL